MVETISTPAEKLSQRAMAALGKLPPFSPILNKLLASLAGEDVSFAKLGDLIEKDTVVAGNIMHLVNSALYARRASNAIQTAIRAQSRPLVIASRRGRAAKRVLAEWPVIAPDILRHSSLFDDSVQCAGHPAPAQAGIDFQSEALTRNRIDHRQDADAPSGAGWPAESLLSRRTASPSSRYGRYSRITLVFCPRPRQHSMQAPRCGPAALHTDTYPDPSSRACRPGVRSLNILPS